MQLPEASTHGSILSVAWPAQAQLLNKLFLAQGHLAKVDCLPDLQPRAYRGSDMQNQGFITWEQPSLLQRHAAAWKLFAPQAAATEAL